jgi:hypothetical protein
VTLYLPPNVAKPVKLTFWPADVQLSFCGSEPVVVKLPAMVVGSTTF